jgi:hypothetical protein
MKEIQTDVTHAEITFGVQLDRLIVRHHDLLYYPHSQNGIGNQYPELKGQERLIVQAVGKAIIERIHIMRDIGALGLAEEIIQARRTECANKLNHTHTE